MHFVNRLLLSTLIFLISVEVQAQDTTLSATTIVPRMVNFSGSAINLQGNPIMGIVGITFTIYDAQQGGSPLWMETQNVQTDTKGNYTVQLGASDSEGLPLSLFTLGEARWLGVRVNGGEEQPRVLLLSVPYALKAADAQTLGGLPASAFVLVAPSSNVTGSQHASLDANSTPSPNIGGSGTQDYIPLWTDNNGDLGNSILFQLGSGASAKIGINETDPLLTLDINGSELVRGLFEMATTGFATPTKAYNSQPLNIESSAYNSSSKKYTLNHFQWQAEPTGNNTASPGATLNLLYGTDPASPTETGLSISPKGLFTFASGQTFPGTGTISGVTAGTDLTGGGSNGSVTLNVDTTKIPQLATANTFTGNQTVNGNMSATGVVSAGSYQIGSNLFDSGSFSNGNAFLGFAGNTAMAGQFNTATGQFALSSNTTGSFNAANGSSALAGNTTGNDNTASGALALVSNTSASDTTAVGYAALGNSNASGPNDAFGSGALAANEGGVANVAVGYQALWSNVGDSVGDGWNNTAVGNHALYMNSGSSGLGASAQNNVAIGVVALYSNTTGSNNTASGARALFSNTTGLDNTATGFGALSSNTTGYNNTAMGEFALVSSTGSQNTAVGTAALIADTTGYNNTAVGVNALSTNVTGSNLTCIGIGCTAPGDLTNATAIGAHALVEQSNSLVLGSSGVNVGIGTTKPSNVLTIGRGAGHPVSDSWETYSSRRWKTNIHPLQNALSKVEQLRGVSYDLKDSGKHEIGVIAEEVGQVVPEVVSYEKNGKDAQGVDYSRLTALLIEAVKQQQTLIAAQQKQIALQQSQLHKQQRLEKAQYTQINGQQLEINTLRQILTNQQNGIAGLSRKVRVLESGLPTAHEPTTTVLASR